MVQGDKVGLIDGERQFTYAELADRVGRLRTGLRALGHSQRRPHRRPGPQLVPALRGVDGDPHRQPDLQRPQLPARAGRARVHRQRLGGERAVRRRPPVGRGASHFASAARPAPAGVDGRRRLARRLAHLGRAGGARLEPAARRPRRRLRRRHHLHGRHDRSAEGRDADPRQPGGQRQAHAVGQPAVRVGPLPAPHADVPLGGRRQHVRPDARRRHPDHLPRLRPRSRRPDDRALPRLGLRARADDDQHVPQPSGHGRARPVVVAAVPLRRLADPDGAPPAGDGRTPVRLLAGLRHDRDVAALLPAHERGPRQGDRRRPRRRAPPRQRRHAVHRRRRRDPPPRRHRRATSARWARSPCADRT